MNIHEKILEIRTVRDKNAFVDYFVNQPKEFEALMEVIFNLEEYPYKEYASWILMHIVKSRRVDLTAHYPRLIDLIFVCENQSVLRSVVCTINEMHVTDYRESELVDLLISFVQDYDNKVALQVYSIYVLIQFIKKYPELKDEIAEIIALHRSGKTAAYKIAERKFTIAAAKI